MNLKTFLQSVALTLIAVIPCIAKAGYTEYGVGGNSCGQWMERRADKSWYDMGQWMLGFVSAVGYYDVHDLKEIDSLAFAAWMDNYCRQHPLQSFGDGVKDLVLELKIPDKP